MKKLISFPILYALFLLLICEIIHTHNPSLLIKIPTRSRPEKFLNVLDLYYKKLSGLYPYHFVISCDNNDNSMKNEAIIERIKSYPNLTLYFSDNSSKVEAYNQKSWIEK